MGSEKKNEKKVPLPFNKPPQKGTRKSPTKQRRWQRVNLSSQAVDSSFNPPSSITPSPLFYSLLPLSLGLGKQNQRSL